MANIAKAHEANLKRQLDKYYDGHTTLREFLTQHNVTGKTTTTEFWSRRGEPLARPKVWYMIKVRHDPTSARPDGLSYYVIPKIVYDSLDLPVTEPNPDILARDYAQWQKERDEQDRWKNRGSCGYGSPYAWNIR